MDEVGAPHGVVLLLCPCSGKLPATQPGWGAGGQLPAPTQAWLGSVSRWGVGGYGCLFISQETEQGAALQITWDDGGTLLPHLSENENRVVWLCLRPQMVMLGGDGELVERLAVSTSFPACDWRRARGGGSSLQDASRLIFVRDLFSVSEKEKSRERMHLPSLFQSQCGFLRLLWIGKWLSSVWKFMLLGATFIFFPHRFP